MTCLEILRWYRLISSFDSAVPDSPHNLTQKRSGKRVSSRPASDQTKLSRFLGERFRTAGRKQVATHRRGVDMRHTGGEKDVLLSPKLGAHSMFQDLLVGLYLCPTVPTPLHPLCLAQACCTSPARKGSIKSLQKQQNADRVNHWLPHSHYCWAVVGVSNGFHNNPM